MAIIEMRQLATGLLSLAIVLVAVGVATSKWRCGPLYDCSGNSRAPALATFALLLLGLVCCGIVLILDIVAHCSNVFTVNPGYITARFVLLYLGTGAMLIGVLVFTGAIEMMWSYFLAVVGTVFAAQVAILAIMASKCVTGGSSSSVTVTRTTRA